MKNGSRRKVYLTVAVLQQNTGSIPPAGLLVHRGLEVQEVAKHCGVCLTTLKKAFSDYAGKGVKAYFTDMKIHRAKELLRMGNPVSEVSDTLGFSSPAYFSQCFKREVGISPQRYRKSFS